MSTIQAALKEPAKTRLLSYYAAIGGLSAAVGQLLGGVIVWADLGGLGWRLIFLINLPLGVVAALGIRAWVPETRADDPDSTDIGGTLLFGAAILGLLIPLSVGRRAGRRGRGPSASAAPPRSSRCGSTNRASRSQGGLPSSRLPFWLFRRCGEDCWCWGVDSWCSAATCSPLRWPCRRGIP